MSKPVPPPVDWDVLGVERVVDGDTVDLRVRRKVGVLGTFDIEATGIIRVRLVHLDTPEKGEPLFDRATDELSAWIYGWDKSVDGGLRVVTHGTDAFGRYICDVYAVADRALTASDYMIRVGNWPVWTG